MIIQGGLKPIWMLALNPRAEAAWQLMGMDDIDSCFTGGRCSNCVVQIKIDFLRVDHLGWAKAHMMVVHVLRMTAISW